MSTPEQVEAILDASIREALAQGYKLETETYGDCDLERRGTLCALSSLTVVGKAGRPLIDADRYYAEVLGIEEENATDITYGFDFGSDVEEDETVTEWTEVGRRLREKYLKGVK